MAKNLVHALLGVTLLAFLAGTAAAAPGHPDKTKLPPLAKHHRFPGAAEFAAGEVLVKFRARLAPAELALYAAQVRTAVPDRAAAVRAFHAFHRTQPRGELLGWQRVSLSAGQRVNDAMAAFGRDALVEAVEPNGLVYAADLSTTYTAQGLPSDYFYQHNYQQWPLNRTQGDRLMNVAVAWQTFDVIVAVVDTGVQLSHPEFTNRLVPGYNVLNPGGQPDDDNAADGGHGTHVAGLIVANCNNSASNRNFAGTAEPGHIKVMPVKVLDSAANGTIYDMAAGIVWASENGAHIINLSLGGYSGSGVLQNSCDYAGNSRNCLLVAAAGNDNLDLTLPGNHYYPAYYSLTRAFVLSIGATDAQDWVTYYSNWGVGCISVAAPGGALQVYYPGFDRDLGVTSTAMGSNYSPLDGTSFSAPQVSAEAALLWLKGGLSRDQIRTAILNNCENPQGELSQTIGNGRVNIFAALGGFGASTLTPSPTFTRTPTPTPSKTITLTATISATSTVTPTRTPTPTISVTSTITPTGTITPTVTPMSLGSGELFAYPLPARDHVRLLYAFQAPGTVSAEVYNMAGHRVLHLAETPYASSGTAYTQVATGELGRGIYFVVLTVQDAGGQRVLKKRVAIVH